MSKFTKEQLEFFNSITSFSWQEKLVAASRLYTDKVVFSTSFSIEDQVITHIIATQHLNIKIFTLDTGRLFTETYQTWQDTIKKYNIEIIPYYPDSKKIEEFIHNYGPNPFYNSKELRLECCYLRKIEPLNRALKGQELWISGLRKSQSHDRGDKNDFEIDNERTILKFYPILNLTDKQLWDFIKKHDIPYNPLYEQGFTSIGCAPCTSIPTDKNDPRSGRWWWEKDSNKECGLHLVNGKLTRK